MKKVTIALCAAGLLALGLGVGVTAAQTASGAFLRYTAETTTWVPYPGLGGELGVKEAVLYGDPAKPGLYAVRIRWPPHVMSRPHSHPEDRFITVLKGTWWTGTTADWDPKNTVAMHAGESMLHPHGQVHYDGARDEWAEIEIVGLGPSTLINAHPGTPDFGKF